ncbi:glycosyltransferase family 2 protein [Mesonia aestuariivivens]|uniref:Glycosyltransferase family 2 protein n=1 Tax=Mesonia aestuariivivens TaxID=2796128 RepID=A0ABS6W0T1_9FLAO|nr:glycosyltransferase family 2 protein [Mesonia aestuariivivens]MBW2961458.1 glycosyltransferase family 2 protein [Mesonia aestuariivivens]
MQLSIVIPLLNEEKSLPELYNWILEVMLAHSFSYEIIFINDGSTDHSWQIIEDLATTNHLVKAIHFKKNYGKSQALHAGFLIAQGDVVITMDADLQDNPEEIPELYQLITKDNLDIVSGWKKKRYDNVITKNLPSKLFNLAARKVAGLELHDFNCGLKAYRLEVVKNIDVYGEMHRYIPLLAKNAGYTKIREKEVKHQARKYGETKFGSERFLHGLLDLITIWFLSKFGKNPMHLFGGLGILMFFVGFLSALYIGVSKLYHLYHQIQDILVTQNPWFYIALTVMIIGTLFFLTGFVAELILRSNRKTERYKVSKTLNH